MNHTINTTTADTLDAWNQEISTSLFPHSILLIVYLVVGSLGNSLVIYVHVFRLQSRKEDRFYIPILAVVDMFSCGFTALFTLALNLLNVKFSNDTACKVLWFLCLGFISASTMILLAIAVDRFRKVCKPFSKQISLYWKKVIVLVIAIISAVLSSPCLLLYGVTDVYDHTRSVVKQGCHDVPELQSTGLHIVFSASLLICVMVILVSLVVLYVLMGRVVFRQMRLNKLRHSAVISRNIPPEMHVLSVSGNTCHEPASSNKTQTPDLSDERKNKNLSKVSDNQHPCTKSSAPKTLSTRTSSSISTHPHITPGVRFTFIFMIITIVFIVCYVPRVVLMIIETVEPTFWTDLSDLEYGLYTFLYQFYIFNNVINPVMYGLFDNTFRRDAAQLFRSCCKIVPTETSMP